MTHTPDPFKYIAQLVDEEWEIQAGFVEDIYYLRAVGHGKVILGCGSNLIYVFLRLFEQVQDWKHEQDDLEWQDEEDTKKSILADLHP